MLVARCFWNVRAKRRAALRVVPLADEGDMQAVASADNDCPSIERFIDRSQLQNSERSRNCRWPDAMCRAGQRAANARMVSHAK
jgi:hypothetical protein